MDNRRYLSAHLEQWTLNLSHKLKKSRHHTVCDRTLAYAEYSPHESHCISRLESQGDEQTRDDTEPGSSELTAVQLVLEMIQFT